MVDDSPEHLTTTEARGGTRTRLNRNVLVFGLLLVVAAFALILFIAR